MENIKLLAELIHKKNEIETEISTIIQRPAFIGHTGEYIASQIFDIQLEDSATNKGYDGYFRSGNLKGKNVNIKWYTKQTNILDINPNCLPDYFLVLSGDESGAISSKNTIAPWVIRNVFLINAVKLVYQLHERNVKIGVATSVTKKVWSESRIYPDIINPELKLTEEQYGYLRLFS